MFELFIAAWHNINANNTRFHSICDMFLNYSIRLFFCITAIRSADFPDSTDPAKSVGFFLTFSNLPQADLT